MENHGLVLLWKDMSLGRSIYDLFKDLFLLLFFWDSSFFFLGSFLIEKAFVR